MQTARAKGDQRTADQDLDRLLLTCPSVRRGVLSRWAQERRGERYEAGLALPHVRWQLGLHPEDRILWAAVYLDGRSVAEHATRARHQLEVEVQVQAGADPGRGEIFRLSKGRAVDLALEGEVIVRLHRAPPGPFSLTVVGPEATTGTMPDEGLLTPPEREPPDRRYGMPRRAQAPSLELAPELLELGAQAARLDNCVNGRGQLETSSVRGSPEPLHPRLVAASLDWLRRFTYRKPSWGPQVGQVCESVYVPFDKATIRAPEADALSVRWSAP